MNEIDKEARRKGLYFVEYQWLPQLVDDVNAGNVGWGVLTDADHWKDIFEVNFPDVSFDWEEFRHEVFKVNEGAAVIVYVFPEPREMPDAAFGAVFVRKEKGACAYYTLERAAEDNIWNLGSMQGGKHQAFGPLAQPSLEAFLKWVVDRHNVI